MSYKSFEIIDYTEKSIAVFGDTKSIKDDLKALGGRFNSRLNYNGEKVAGWIFPIHLRNEIEALLEISDKSTDSEITLEIDKNEKHHHSDVSDLPKSVKLLCKLQGNDVIFGNMFVNALSDYNAFPIPLYKNVLKILIREGYLNIFESKDKWNRTYQQTINNVCYNFGWSDSIVRYIFDSIAYGVNYLRKKPIYSSGDNVSLKDTFPNEKTFLDNNKIKPAKDGKHLTFKGVEINGSLYNMRIQLKKKGFTFVDKDENFLYLEGDFAGFSNCEIVVASSPYINLVFGITVYLPQQSQWDDLKSEYLHCKELFTKKYGNPQSYEYFISPYEEGDDFEMTAVLSDKCVFASVFETPLGEILVHISNDGRVIFYYKDGYNSSLDSEARSIQADLDI